LTKSSESLDLIVRKKKKSGVFQTLTLLQLI